MQIALQGKSSIGTYISKETGKLSTIVGIPVKIDGVILGVFFAGIDNVALSHDMLGDMSLSSHGSAFVYNPQGEVILHSDITQLGARTAIPSISRKCRASGRDGWRSSRMTGG